MAYVVEKSVGRWEMRESHATKDGPRSKTLVTFTVLTPEAVQRAVERSTCGLTEVEVKALAVRAGSSIQEPSSNKAARELLAEVANGRRPSKLLYGLLADALSDQDAGVTDSMRAASSWINSDMQQRGSALYDLLLLADRLPHGRQGALKFPTIKTAK